MKRRVRYCLDCGWRIRDDECENPSTRMIQHATETGHTLNANIEAGGEVLARPSEEHRFFRD